MSASGTRTCSNCGRPGHDRRSCEVPANASRCGLCGFLGHDKRNCPKR